MFKLLSCFSLLLMICLPALSYSQVNMSALPPRSSIEISFTENHPPVVRETRQVRLDSGINQLEFRWNRVTINPRLIELYLPPEKAIELIETERFLDVPALTWSLDSAQRVSFNLQLLYQVENLNRETSYRAVLQPDSKLVDLYQYTSLFNNSGEDFVDATVVLDEQLIEQQTLRDGESRRFLSLRQEAIPYWLTYHYTAGEHPGRRDQEQPLKVSYGFHNPGDPEAASSLMPAGKLQLFEKNDQGKVFLSETKLAAFPAGDTVNLSAGKSRDIAIEERLLEEERMDVFRDEDGIIQLYNSKKSWRFEIENFRPDTVTLQLDKPMEGEWEIVDSSHPTKRINARLIRFKLELPPTTEIPVELSYIIKHRGRRLR